MWQCLALPPHGLDKFPCSDNGPWVGIVRLASEEETGQRLQLSSVMLYLSLLPPLMFPSSESSFPEKVGLRRWPGVGLWLDRGLHLHSDPSSTCAGVLSEPVSVFNE